MASAAIRHIFYRPEKEELSVWFGPEWRRYKYYGVPEALYAELLAAPSRGRFYNQHIKGRFEVERILEERRRRAS